MNKKPLHSGRKSKGAGRHVLRRACLAREVFELALAATESFAADEIGVDLAYLLGAILEPSGKGCVDWTVENHVRRPALLRILKKRLSAKHAVWDYISMDSRPKTRNRPSR